MRLKQISPLLGDDGAVISRVGIGDDGLRALPGRPDPLGPPGVGYVAPSAARFRDTGWASLLVQAGTATSTRSRGEVNAFNLTCIKGLRIAVENLGWAAGALSLTATARFQFGWGGWSV